MKMAVRLGQFQTDLEALAIADVQNSINFKGWLADYGNYITSGGDRPPHKPPTA